MPKKVKKIKKVQPKNDDSFESVEDEDDVPISDAVTLYDLLNVKKDATIEEIVSPLILSFSPSIEKIL